MGSRQASAVSRDRWRWAAATYVLCILLIGFLQIHAGAYRADFDGYPDEASHFVTGLMVHDFLATPAVWGDPMNWAANYYLHYPKVALGQWPPAFHLMEALWFFPFGTSRSSVLLLEAALTLASAVILYHTARRLYSGWISCLAAILLVAAPSTAYCYSMAMADIPCLLWSVLVLDATARLLRKPSSKGLALAGLWLTLAMLTKGNGAALAPAPVLAAILSGVWRKLPVRPILWACGLLLTLSSAWYLVQTFIFNRPLQGLGGLFLFTLPWRIDILPYMTGYGCVALSALGGWFGLRRRAPEALAALAMAVSCIAVSFVLRAMNEPRHWIVILPAIFILTAEAFTALEKRGRVALALGAAALLATYPYRWETFPENGFQKFERRVARHPDRMLISSNWIGEGAWIAESALREPRPSSFLIRANKTLAEEGWNADHYRLLTASKEEVLRILDELRVETVVAQTSPDRPVPPHHTLLIAAMGTSDSWSPLAAEGQFQSWKRVRPATLPRRLLRLDLTTRIGRVVEEQDPK